LPLRLPIDDFLSLAFWLYRTAPFFFSSSLLAKLKNY